MKKIRAVFRLVSFVGITLGFYGTWWAGAWVIRNELAWRRVIFRNWARWFVKLSNLKITVVGTPPQPPFFLVCNHLGYVDIPVIRAVVEGVYVAKGEIESWFAAGKIVGDIGNIFIDRNNRRDIPRAGADILKALDRNEGVIVFPEGTSTNGETVLPFKSSFFEFAAAANLPVHYCSISYHTPDDEALASHAVCWSDDTPLSEHMQRFFSLSGVTATITFGNEPISGNDRKELAEKLWKAVNETFVPVL